VFELDRPDDVTEQAAQGDDPPLALEVGVGEDAEDRFRPAQHAG
jgi:hypothetical protein